MNTRRAAVLAVVLVAGPTRASELPESLVLTGHTNGVLSVAWRPDGKALASTGWDNTVRLWDPATGKETAVLKGHDHWAGAHSVAWRPDGKALASAGNDSAVRVWAPAAAK